MDELNLDYVNALTLLTAESADLKLVLVGCGGTGSWLVPAVVRVGKLLIERFSKNIEIEFYDPDLVEEKNIYRQNFCAAEIGLNKAEALAERYGLAWGVEVAAFDTKFEQERGFSSAVIIGCVDNPEARKSMKNTIYHGISWLDCGNTKNYGQVLIGSGAGVSDPFAMKGFCGFLPYPHQQHPELIKDKKPGKKNREPVELELSCAEMALQDSQGLAINQRMAAEAADYLVRMLITKDLKKFATYIDLESGTTRSKYITEKAIKEYGKA